LPPGDELPDVLGVNLYLYRVAESPFTKNRSWPGDRATPPTDQPALGLFLHYLLTPLAPRPEQTSLDGDTAHTTLGLAMLTLHEHPVLNDVHLPDFDADIALPDFLLNSYEQVKICLMSIGTEELSRIWATINQPYRLSVAYEVSLVQLTPTPPPPVGGGIVLTTGVNVITLDPPRLAELTPSAGALARIVGGVVTANTLRISGFGLSFPGQTPIVQIGGQPAAIQSTPAPTDQALTVSLPTNLDAGPQVDVRARLNQRTSTPLVFTITPWLTGVRPLRTALEGPSVTLELEGSGLANPQAVRFEGPGGTTPVTVFDPGGSDTRASVTVPPGLANGVYNVRLVLNDGASSASNARMLEVIPRIDTPIGLATVTVNSRQVHRLTLGGARLSGADVRLVIDGVVYQAGANANAAQLVYTLGRQLNAGTHQVAVSVDGQMSHTVALEV
jgi:hypothetical protein